MNVPIPSIATSKKFLAATAASILTYFAIKQGFSTENIALLTGPLYAYVVAQGVADMGKEKVRAEKAP